MDAMQRWIGVMALGALVACGPPSPAGAGESESEATTEPPSTSEDPTTAATDSSSSESESETETETEEDLSEGFVPNNDISSFPAPCEMINNSECPEGNKCVPGYIQGEFTRKCVPILGEGEVGEACERDEDDGDTCNGESWCAYGGCRDYCTGTYDDPSCSEATDACMVLYENAWVACMPSCDPLTQGCAAGEGCYLTGTGLGEPEFVCLPHAEPPAGLSGPCTDALHEPFSCAPGSMCVVEMALPSCEAATCCAAFCDLSQPDPTCEVPGTSCEPLFYIDVFTDLPPEYGQIGVCVLPS